MIEKNKKKNLIFKNSKEKCEECNNEHVSVIDNLILTGFKICKSCKISKTIFPV